MQWEGNNENAHDDIQVSSTLLLEQIDTIWDST